MADAAFAYESWVGSDTIINGQASGSSWDTCALGTSFLPGVVTIENLEVGRDIDVQKRKKKEKARLRDNGLSPVTFDIIVELTGAQWFKWLEMLPLLLPKEGVPRKAFSITHPMVNAYGVSNIYIHKMKLPAPSARKGMRIEIHCGEWMEEEIDAKPMKKGEFPRNANQPDYLGDPAALAAQMAKNEGRLGPGEDIDNVMKHAGFDPQPPTEPQPGELGWKQRKPPAPPPAPGALQKALSRVDLGSLS